MVAEVRQAARSWQAAGLGQARGPRPAMRSGLLAVMLAPAPAPALALAPAMAPALAMAVAGPVAVAAQEPRRAAAWATVAAHAEIVVSESGSAVVRLDYLLGSSEPDVAVPEVEPILLKLLGVGDATVREVMVDGAPLVLWPASGSLRAAVLRPSAVPAGETLSLSIEYTVARAAEIDGSEVTLRVPLVTGPRPVEDGEGFVTDVEVPAGWVMGDGFPSGLRQTEEGVWIASLPVVPSVVRLQGRTDGVRRIRLPLVVDVLTVGLLLAFALFGWRHLSGVVREARS